MRARGKIRRPIVSGALGVWLVACANGLAERVPFSTDGPEAATEPARVPFLEYNQNILLRVTIEDVGTLLLIYDSRTSAIVIDRGEAAKLGISAGQHAISVGSVSLGTRTLTVGTTLVGGAAVPGLPNEPVRGYAGGGLFEGFSVDIDSRDQELVLTPTRE